jgi:hypothetical protein
MIDFELGMRADPRLRWRDVEYTLWGLERSNRVVDDGEDMRTWEL